MLDTAVVANPKYTAFNFAAAMAWKPHRSSSGGSGVFYHNAAANKTTAVGDVPAEVAAYIEFKARHRRVEDQLEPMPAEEARRLAAGGANVLLDSNSSVDDIIAACGTYRQHGQLGR